MRPVRDYRRHQFRGDSDIAGTEFGRAGRRPEEPHGELVPVEILEAGPARPGPAASAGRVESDSEVERVGGRHRIRGEFVLMVAAAVFVVGALIKPWAGALPPEGQPSSTPPDSGLALVEPSPPDLGAGLETGPAPTDRAGPFGRSPMAWSQVDWSALTATLTDSGWGVATVTLPPYSRFSSGAQSAVPTITWLASTSTSMTATFTLAPEQDVYAVGVTWPRGVAASDVAFVYNAPGLFPAAEVGAGAPLTPLTPLPASMVAAALPSPAPSATTIPSGRFWVAPAAPSVLAAQGSPAESWRMMPWSWPPGEYQITIRSKAGDQTMTLRLEQQP